MNWSENMPPINGKSYYDHTTLESPIGQIIIEWKSWKESPGYDVMINGDWIGFEYDLDNAKKLGENHIINIYSALKSFINADSKNISNEKM